MKKSRRRHEYMEKKIVRDKKAKKKIDKGSIEAVDTYGGLGHPGDASKKDEYQDSNESLFRKSIDQNPIVVRESPRTDKEAESSKSFDNGDEETPARPSSKTSVEKSEPSKSLGLYPNLTDLKYSGNGESNELARSSKILLPGELEIKSAKPENKAVKIDPFCVTNSNVSKKNVSMVRHKSGQNVRIKDICLGKFRCLIYFTIACMVSVLFAWLLSHFGFRD